ncbi:MAG: prepilin-type N-terminal cleavage/methylation domain-containing protein [Deltaproteobacteria bacterium]|nr:prepilin-type N-terminal cleavage/methylation domain-containing protein [Candidatus Tharpella aukensis]
MKKRFSSSPTAAFTLVELIVVIAIMGMGLSIFLGINYRQRDSFRWRANLRELHVFLKVARSYAVLERQRNDCRYNPKQHVFSEGLRGRRVELASGVKFVLSDEQQALVEIEKSKSEVADVEAGEIEAEIVMVTFYADGGASGGPLEISSDRRGAFLEVDPLTGAVKVEERDVDDIEE